MSVTLPIIGRISTPKNRKSIESLSNEFINDSEHLLKVNNLENMLKKIQNNQQLRWNPILENFNKNNYVSDQLCLFCGDPGMGKSFAVDVNHLKLKTLIDHKGQFDEFNPFHIRRVKLNIF